MPINHLRKAQAMRHKVYVNNDAIEVRKDMVTARELVELTGRKGGDYKLELRDGPHGPLLKEFSGDDIIDLGKECGRGGTPGKGPEGGARQTTAGTGAERSPGEDPEGGAGNSATSTEAGSPDGTPGKGPEEGGATHTTVDDAPCYFVTDYTGSINPA